VVLKRTWLLGDLRHFVLVRWVRTFSR
jgi:hypothetical protein